MSNDSTNNTPDTATDATEGTAPALGSDAAANVLATFQDDAANGAAPVEPRDSAPSGRFADLELDAGTEIPALPAPVEPSRVLEIDGVDAYSDEPETASTEGAAVSALRQSGLDFEVKLVQPRVDPADLPFGSSWTQPPNAGDFQYCMRMDTGHVFGVTSPGYGFVQPVELAELVDAALPKGADEVKVRSSSFGDHLWFDCPLPEGTFEVTPKMQAEANATDWIHIDPRDKYGNTPVTGRLVFKHAYGGKGSYDVWMMLEALICGNGARVALKEGNKQIKIRHTVNFEHRVADLKRAFEVAGDMVQAYAGMFQNMASTPITMKQFDAYCEALFPGQSTQAKNKRARLAEINASAIGCAPGTAWGALQSATYYATHETSVRVGGRSLSRYTLDDPRNLNGAQIEAIQGQARLESMVYGDSGAFTEKALQYVTTNFVTLD
jgi:hypothetical protein